MRVIISPSKACGKVAAPPSKSMAHRMLICGAMTEKSVITNVVFSEDILATLDGLSALGADVLRDGDTVTIGGLGRGEFTPRFSCRESGSTLRFLLPLCLTLGTPVTLEGTERLFSRDLSAYESFCAQHGFSFEKTNTSATVCGSLKSGEYSVMANASSQFVSGLLFALSYAQGESVLHLDGNVESRPYIDLTVQSLNDFGVSVKWRDERTLIVSSGGAVSLCTSVEGDWSNAAFLDALGFLGGEVTVTGLREDSLQGDRVYRELFKKLGKEVIDLSDCPDLAPVLFALAATVGKCEFVGTRRLKIKESDRAAAMKEELSKFGVMVKVEENRVVVHGGEIHAPTETLSGHNDHRIVMALSVLCTLTGGEIDGAGAVSKSFPDFFEVYNNLNLNGRIVT